MIALPYVIASACIAVVFVWPAWRTFRREEAEGRRLLAEAEAAGRTEPVTIRPWVNPELCMGSGTCVSACPEGNVLQVIDGIATLVDAASCVGHGACEAACPVDAIELLFGSERRGVDLPEVGPDFESNVPGLYIAGELGGMGLIANAINQGRQAVGHIQASLPRSRSDDLLDLVIVGAGPAGLAASLAAQAAGMSHLMVEQGELGGSVRHFPRQKIVMAHGMQLPGEPKVKAGTLSKEELIDMFTSVAQAKALPIRAQTRVLGVDRDDDGVFSVRLDDEVLRCRRVMLAVGRRGTPRTLNCEGEDRSKVAYAVLDPERIHHAHVLVVGGGDSAVEAALQLAESTGNRVTLSYRGESITRPKQKLCRQLEAAVEAGRVTLQLRTEVRSICADRVTLTGPSGDLVLPNDQVYIFAGGVLPTAFLRDAGIQLQRHFGQRVESLPG